MKSRSETTPPSRRGQDHLASLPTSFPVTLPVVTRSKVPRSVGSEASNRLPPDGISRPRFVSHPSRSGLGGHLRRLRWFNVQFPRNPWRLPTTACRSEAGDAFDSAPLRVPSRVFCRASRPQTAAIPCRNLSALPRILFPARGGPLLRGETTDAAAPPRFLNIAPAAPLQEVHDFPRFPFGGGS